MVTNNDFVEITDTDGKVTTCIRRSSIEIITEYSKDPKQGCVVYAAGRWFHLPDVTFDNALQELGLESNELSERRVISEYIESWTSANTDQERGS